MNLKEDNIKSIKIHEKVGFNNTGYKWDELEPGFPKEHLGFIYQKQ